MKRCTFNFNKIHLIKINVEINNPYYTKEKDTKSISFLLNNYNKEFGLFIGNKLKFVPLTIK